MLRFAVQIKWLVSIWKAKLGWNGLIFLITFNPFKENLPQKQPSEVFHKKAVLKNFAIFTGKHLCWSLFNKVGNTYYKGHLQRLLLLSITKTAVYWFAWLGAYNHNCFQRVGSQQWLQKWQWLQTFWRQWLTCSKDA